ncbi:MAG: dienelactone hydrolase family protein [Deinococcota bacterium]
MPNILQQFFKPKPTMPILEVGKETFPYLEVHTPDVTTSKPALLVGLHGFGSDETQLQTLLDLELDIPFAYLAPRAWYTLTDGGYAWFPLERTDGGFTTDRAQVFESLALLEAFIQAAINTYNADPNKVFLVGYSQGGGMSLSYYLHKPETIAGAVALSGALLSEMIPDQLESSTLGTIPLFVGQGTLDTLISQEERLNQKQWLEQHNIPLTYCEYPIPHVVSQQQRRDVQTWLQQRLV